MYALYERDRRILGILIAISIASVVVGCWSIIAAPSDEVPRQLPLKVPGCITLLSDSEGRRLAVAWSGVLVFDTCVFSLTSWKALKLGRRGRLLNTLLRDGTLYFVALALANLSNVLSYLFASPLLKGLTTTFTNVLSATLISRLMLNTRAQTGFSTLPTDYSTTTATPPLSTILDELGEVEIGDRMGLSSGTTSGRGDDYGGA
ncbi:hypothetical protein EW146_g4069 [Bondarzewia mesenterica]|uniref:Uncharacterized protein n=1 Tax=Bondarzewia mesenterica TaxID=1095465 RepID=A0A4S4LXI3_9AGAM|nr:hypothetical protein EW146_g4069 [Bondarzewia mesenterica]